MKPITLTMQAFGPYANIEHINFRMLENRTMFVISGKTGSGKTTIFDGIAFAIYGRTSGEERTGTDLRSQFANASVLTEVTLQFSLKNRHYKIIRSPQQEKQKTRGDGFTTINTKAELYQLDNGEERLLAGNVREVDEKIRSLMQLDFHQFKQILMIPQGEFRKLLTSDSKDKEQILQKLFHTELFKNVQDHLKEKAGHLERQVGQSRMERLKWIGSIDPLDHEKLKNLLTADSIHEEMVLSLAKNLVATQKEEKKQLSKELATERTKRDQLMKEMERAIYIDEAFVQLARLKEEVQELTQQQQQINEQKERIVVAKQAEKLWPVRNELNEKKRVLEERVREIKSFEKALDKATSDLVSANQADQKLEQRREENELLQQELHDVLALEDKITERKSFEQSLTKITQQGMVEKKSLNHMEEQLKTTQQEISMLDKELSQLNDSKLQSYEEKDQLQSKRYVLQLIERALRINSQLRQWTDRIVLLKEENIQTENQVKEANEEKKEIERQFYSSQAVILSRQLHQDEPCPVCGSSHHPNKATGDDHHVSEQELAIAAEKWQLALSDREKGLVELNQASERLKEINLEKSQMTVELESILGEFEWTRLDQIKLSVGEEIVQKEQIIRKMDQDTARAKQSLAKKDSLVKSLEQLTVQFNNQTINVQQKRDQFVEAQTNLNRLSGEIPNEYLDEVHYQKKIQELKNLISSFEAQKKQAEEQASHLKEHHQTISNRLDQTREERDKEQHRLAEIQTKWHQSLEESAFEDEQHLIESRISELELAQNEHHVQQFEQQFYSTKQQMNTKEKELENIEKADRTLLNEQLKKIDEILQNIETNHHKVTSYIERHESLLDRIEENARATATLEEEYSLVGHLADMANGKNHLRLTFERYVLAFYLEDILFIANDRLSKMTSGRYQLLRKEDKSKGNVQGGLELLIFDQYTGQQRHVKTLSGGEAFKASLSLALGLAEVVQSHAGGVSLETMFIDEGFGTLDPESLDQAIESLMDIQSSGRLVGVISHVPELKERIDARLEVESTQQGSTTAFYFTS